MSISGEVTAPVVYAHSGNPDDYDLLRKNGISVKGKIVLVRYSNPYSYRGFKALTAQREGAAAILIYSDPAEDGYKKGKVDPDGPWGPEYQIQRGAITYDFIVPGDPLTPGWASVPGAKRIPIEQAQSAPKIMALPLSWHDAKPLLENMDGPIAPENWQGGLPLQYRLGGDRVKVHLKIEMDNGIQPYYVVEGRIRGARIARRMGRPRQSSRCLGLRRRRSFQRHRVDDGTYARPRPTRKRRPCVPAARSWSAVGTAKKSASPAPPNGENNSPTNSAPRPSPTSTSTKPHPGQTSTARQSLHSRRCWWRQLAPCKIRLARVSTTAWRATAAREKEEGNQSGQINDSGIADSGLADTRIGSGSDHTVFLNFVGMPVIGLQFDGDYGVYHSAYDDFYWMNHFGDPGYRYHTLMSQLWGVTALRLANADLLPFDFASYASNIRQFVNELS